MPDDIELPGRFKAVFISPHLDDAVLSCGGTLAQLAASDPVLVVNVFTHYPNRYHRGAINAGQERHAEERNAARYLGYRSLNLGETDAIFRKTTRGSARRLFLPPRLGDIDSLGKLSARIEECLSGIEYETLYLPMGIGWHVDHMLCHLATRHYLGRPNVLLYEDAPYCLVPNAARYRVHELGRAPGGADLVPPSLAGLFGDWLVTSRSYLSTAPVASIRPYPLRLAANMVVAGYLGQLMARHLRPSSDGRRYRLEALSRDVTATFDRKISACYLYESQINEFFFDRSDFVERYSRYSETLGKPRRQYERFWQMRG
ncbi:MAG: PIG-L family deacetylase [Gammaproteobacteria bacterium]